MSIETEQAHGSHRDHPEADEPHPGATHFGDLQYVYVAVFLAAITGLEVSTYFVDFGGAHIPLLLVLMVVKFGFVAAYFMHLKFDSVLFRRVFIAGLILAVGCYIAVLATFHFFE
jgi:caa(3)-type oxidase subunit IV